MAEIATIITALATQLRTISDPQLQVVEDPNGEVLPPAILIDSPESVTPTNLDETDFTLTFPLILIAPMNDLIQARRTLHAYLSPTGTKSIRACLMANPTLSGMVQDLEIGPITPPGIVYPDDPDNEAPFYGAQITIEVDV